MSDKKITLSIVYSACCVIILNIAGLIAGIGLMALVIRTLVFGSISFLLVFLAQLFLQNNIIDDEFIDGEEADNVRGSTLDIVVDDSYNTSGEQQTDTKSKDEANGSARSVDEVAYNKDRRVGSEFFENSLHESGSDKVADDFVDLSHEIEKSKKNANRDPSKVSNALKKWVQDAQPKKM